MNKVIALALLCLVAGAPVFGDSEGKNIVLGRPYTYWPEPKYYDSLDPENDSWAARPRPPV